jgi:peptidoglycan/LPS O-acetylase OafA/YrhL
VFFHHAAIYHGLFLIHSWDHPPSRFYTYLGPIGVSMFFMVSGYLFWKPLVRARSKPDWLQFFVARVFRIGPLYVVAVSVALTIAFVKSGLVVHVPYPRLAYELARWILSLGSAGAGSFNGLDEPDVLLGVTWTIQWEWCFYFSLPLLAIAARKKRAHLPFTCVALALCLLWLIVSGPIHSTDRPTAALVTLFLLGMLCASLRENEFALKLEEPTASLILLALMAMTFVFPKPYSAPPLCCWVPLSFLSFRELRY